MKKRFLKGKKGFTLIELIVVIAILAVLAMLALPTFSGLIAKSEQEVAQANARTIYTAAKAYVVMENTTPSTNFISELKDLLGSGINITGASVTYTGGKITVTYPYGDGQTATYSEN